LRASIPHSRNNSAICEVRERGYHDHSFPYFEKKRQNEPGVVLFPRVHASAGFV
jgi:hypothetical protein